jgi:integrase
MARTLKEAKITTSASRNSSKLPVRIKPHYRQIESGLHLGFKKAQKGGYWCLRYYLGDGKYQVETFATAIANDGASFKSLDFAKVTKQTPLNFDQAQRVAKCIHQARQVEAVHGHHGPLTVRQAVEKYIKFLKANRKSAVTAERFARVHIYPKLGKLEAAALTADQLRKWHEAIAKSPRRKRVAPGAAPVFCEPPTTPDQIRARKSTANRIRAVLVAALNHAYLDGRLPSDLAWKRARPFTNTEMSRNRYFTRDECKRLINACDPDFRELVLGALYTGARYGDLCRMNVGDFDPDSATAQFHMPKSGKPYSVHLNAEAADWFASITAGRSASEPMFRKAKGKRWRDSHQHRPFSSAVERASITPPGSFHTLRHTYASLAIMAGAPLHVVAANLGHRDDKMVQRHYGHLADDYRAKIMRETAPTFGLGDSNVVSLG